MKRMRWSACLVVLLLPLLLLFSLASVGAAPLVEETQAVVQADASLPPLIQARMQTSVKAIADQLLAGHPLPSVQPLPFRLYREHSQFRLSSCVPALRHE